MKTIPEIKAICREIIALGERATSAPWTAKNYESGLMSSVQFQSRIVSVSEWNAEPDSAFIAASRTFSPQAAEALLVAIEALEEIFPEGFSLVPNSDERSAKYALNEICKLFP